jgi:hypothetical protein
VGGRCLFTAYLWGKPWSGTQPSKESSGQIRLQYSRQKGGEFRSSGIELSAGNSGGGKFPSQISRRKDQAGSLGTEEKTSPPFPNTHIRS